MLDNDLAALYEVPTFRLNEAVKRNSNRFPLDFMFQLTADEAEALTSQFAISNKKRGGRRTLPYAILIVRAFVRLREYLSAHSELSHKVEDLQRTQDHHSAQLEHIYECLQQLQEPPAEAAKPSLGPCLREAEGESLLALALGRGPIEREGCETHHKCPTQFFRLHGSKHPPRQTRHIELRRIRHRHHRHHPCLHGIGHHQIRSIGNTPGHIQTDHK